MRWFKGLAAAVLVLTATAVDGRCGAIEGTVTLRGGKIAPLLKGYISYGDKKLATVVIKNGKFKTYIAKVGTFQLCIEYPEKKVPCMSIVSSPQPKKLGVEIYETDSGTKAKVKQE